MQFNPNTSISNSAYQPLPYSDYGSSFGASGGTNNLLNDLVSDGLQLPRGKRGRRSLRIIDSVIQRVTQSFERIFSQMTQMMQSVFSQFAAQNQTIQQPGGCCGNTFGDAPTESPSNDFSLTNIIQELLQGTMEKVGGGVWGLIGKGASWAGGLLGKAGSFLKGLF